MTWKPGDALPHDECWTWAMVEQFTKRTRRTLQRRGLPHISGEPGLFDPATVRAFFGVTAPRIQLDTNRVYPTGTY